MKTKHFCEGCGSELRLTHNIEISQKITEFVSHNNPLLHTLHKLYEIVEGDYYDAVTYDYEKVKIQYECCGCKNTYSTIGEKLS